MTHTPILAPKDAYALWAPTYPPYAHNPVMHAEERAMLALLPETLTGQHVLDAGCGSGRYIRHALQRDAAHVAGIDLSPDMLARADEELDAHRFGRRFELKCGDLTALPMPDAWADITISGLAIGHVLDLHRALYELHRVTRPGGLLICSDFHPIGHALGWLRDFKAHGQRYAVRHTSHLYSDWHAACAQAGLEIEHVLEPMLDPAGIPAQAHFDGIALEVPVALVFRLRRTP